MPTHIRPINRTPDPRPPVTDEKKDAADNAVPDQNTASEAAPDNKAADLKIAPVHEFPTDQPPVKKVPLQFPSVKVPYPVPRAPAYVLPTPLPPTSIDSGPVAPRSAVRTLDIEIAALQSVRRSLEGLLGSRLQDAVNLTRSIRGRIHVVGVGKSGHIARKVAATLTSTGTLAHFLHATEASHGDLGAVHPDDLLLILSWSGDTPELQPITEYARRKSIPLIAITAYPRSPLALAATIILKLPMALEACPDNLAPTTSTTMQLVLGDAFALALLEARALAPREFPSTFHEMHPGGTLGARLTPAHAIMHSADRLPLVHTDTPLSEAIVEMSRKGFGVTGVLSRYGALVGIVTDGDLRRAFGHTSGQDLMSTPVEAIMTHSPWTIDPQTRAPEILAQMNTRRVTTAFVVPTPNEPPIGLVHIHDLLRIGL
jgi:arabinose-5-phosphate isomerase